MFVSSFIVLPLLFSDNPVVFEVVSAYGTVGLSLGVPYVSRFSTLRFRQHSLALRQDNFSFSGALRPLSKLIICAVMLRGRHRGLPVAIDRAVMLPVEFSQASQDRLDEIASNNVRRSSMSMQLDGMNSETDERSQFRRAPVRSPSTILTNGPEIPQSPPNPSSPQSLLQQQQQQRNDHVETQ